MRKIIIAAAGWLPSPGILSTPFLHPYLLLKSRWQSAVQLIRMGAAALFKQFLKLLFEIIHLLFVSSLHLPKAFKNQAVTWSLTVGKHRFRVSLYICRLIPE